MKILHTVESYYPSVGGMQEVVKQISEELVRLGHEVTVATSYSKDRKEFEINGVKIIDFKIGGGEVKGYIGEDDEINKYKNFVVNGDFDIVTSFAAQQWATDLLLPLLKDIKARKVFVPTGFSELYSPVYAKYFEKMKQLMKSYDQNVFLSEDYRDINFAKENGIKNISIIPNGASGREFEGLSSVNMRKNLGVPADSFVVLLVGSHSGLKGHKEAIKIFRKANINDSYLIIVGNGNTSCTYLCKAKSFINNLISIDKKILVKELNRQETVDLYKSVDVFLFPSYIECSPLVLFEAMAARIPFLTTDVGNSKEIIKWSNGGQLIETFIDEHGYSRANINDGVSKLRELYKNDKVRNELATKGYNAWKNNFTWRIIAQKYENLYKTLINA